MLTITIILAIDDSNTVRRVSSCTPESNATKSGSRSFGWN